jgi:regulator of cell morphogenesis and NO signaling
MATQDWKDRTLRELIKHLVDEHHAFTRRTLDELAPLATNAAATLGGRHPYLIEVHCLLRELRDDMQSHLAAEEQVLFPFVEELDIASRTASRGRPASQAEVLDGPVRSLLFDHDHASDVLNALRTTTRDYAIPADADETCQALFEKMAALDADLVQHMELEEKVLIPRAKALAGLA